MATGKARTPNLILRHIRETERRESREEFAEAVVRAGQQLGDHHLACDARLVARWEDGEVGRPRPAYQRALAALIGRPFDELGFQPRNAIEVPSTREAGDGRLSLQVDGEGHPGLEAGIDPAVAAASDPGETIIPCRTADGRIIWVSVPRRMFLRGGLGLAAGAAVGFGPGQVPTARPHWRPAPGAADVHPVEHLRHLRAVLVDSDNLLGPRSAIQTVQDHLGMIQQLREQSSGADRRALLQVQGEYAEFAGWLHQDIGDFAAARFWLDRALESAHAAGDGEFAAFVLARKSQLAGDLRDPAGALDLAEAAARAGQAHPRLVGAALTYAAHGHALDGLHTESMQMLDRAHQYAGQTGEDAARLANWLDTSYIEVQRARCLSILGRHADAASIFERALNDLGPQYRRDRGVYLARAARAHAGGRDPERAAEAGRQALAIAHQTGSGRITAELAVLDTDLTRWKGLPSVTEFHDALTDSLPRQVPEPPQR